MTLVLAQTVAEMIANAVASVASVAAPRFMSLTYRNEQGELARHTLMIGLNMVRAYERDLALVSAYLKRANLTPIQTLAATEIRESLAESLTKGIGYNSRYVHGPNAADTFVNILPGVSVNKSDNEEDRGTVYLLAYGHRKTILEPGTYKEVKSREKTLIKNAIKRELHLRTDRIKRFKLKEVTRCAVEGKTLILTAPTEREALA